MNKATSVFDGGVGLGTRLLIQTEQTEDFEKRIENLKSFIVYKHPCARFHQIGSRLSWTIPRPTKYKQDNVELLFAVLLERSENDEKRLVSGIEKSVSLELERSIEKLLSEGHEAIAIPTLYANAAYYVLQKKGLVS